MIEFKIQADITGDELKVCIDHIDEFVKSLRVDENGRFSWSHLTHGGHRGIPLKRNVLGYPVSKKYDLVFRRISKNKKIFGIVRIGELASLIDGSPLKLDGCLCVNCNGGTRVIWKTVMPEMVTVLTIPG